MASCAWIGGRDLKSRLFDSKLSLIEFVRNKHSASPFMGPYRYPVYYELLKTITATKRHQKVSIHLTLIGLSAIIPPFYLRFWAVMWSRYQVETAMNWERIRENKLNIVSSNFFILRHCRLNRGHQWNEQRCMPHVLTSIYTYIYIYIFVFFVFLVAFSRSCDVVSNFQGILALDG